MHDSQFRHFFLAQGAGNTDGGDPVEPLARPAEDPSSPIDNEPQPPFADTIRVLHSGDLDESRTPLAKYPTLEAFVSAAALDPTGVRAALESWIAKAPTQETRIERQAQLHYWLFRAGDAGELERLRALATEHPTLLEVAMYFRLAVQDLDELWS